MKKSVINRKKIIGGHEKACGSPRGVKYTFQNAIDVFTQVSWTYFETK